MVTCPWCGTSYPVFQSECSKCGGPLNPPEVAAAALETPLIPPAPPRPISDSYAMKLMSSDGWAISSLIFFILGIVFAPLGLILTLVVVTAFVGLPFLLLGGIFLLVSTPILLQRYRLSQQQVQVLKMGEATLGHLTSLKENYSVQVNGRHPWSIEYQYELNGQDYHGQVTTLNPPGSQLQPGRQVYVLYLNDNPTISSLYPHP